MIDSLNSVEERQIDSWVTSQNNLSEALITLCCQEAQSRTKKKKRKKRNKEKKKNGRGDFKC